MTLRTYHCSECGIVFKSEPPKYKVGDRVWVESQKAYGRITAVRPPRCTRCEEDEGHSEDDISKQPE